MDSSLTVDALAHACIVEQVCRTFNATYSNAHGATIHRVMSHVLFGVDGTHNVSEKTRHVVSIQIEFGCPMPVFEW